MSGNAISRFRASPQQRRIWQLREDGSGAAYRALAVVRADGVLDRSRLEEALREVVSRHEILRTSFRPAEDGGEVSQIVQEEMPIDIEWHAAAVEARFDLERGPVLRVAVEALAESGHHLQIALPALCADRATLENLAREIAAAYAGGERGDGEVLQYADVAQWQNEMLESDELAAGRESWREQAAATDLELRLPFARAAAGSGPFTPRKVALTAGPLLERLSAQVGEHGVSLAAWLLAAWGLLLWKRSGGVAFPIGHACDGRRIEDLKEVLGPLTRYVPVAVRPEPGIRFLDLVREAGHGIEEAKRRQEYFWQPSFFPLVFELGGRPALQDADGLAFSLLRAEACFDRFDLGLWGELSDGLSLELRYDPERFNRDDIECLAGQLAALLHGTIADPLSRIEDLGIQSLEERRRVLADFNATSWDAPTDRGLHELVEEQARRHPDRRAILFEDRQLTYGELDRRAAIVAGRLRRLGVRPDVPVAVFFERAPEALIAILAILKAGGAYVPLDPRYPPARLALMLEDCAAPVILTEAGLVSWLPDHGAQILFLDDADGEEALESQAETGPGNLAYVIYTSGSTGRPKGVLVTHGNAVHSMTARFRYHADPAEAFVLLWSIAFDGAVAGIFWTLGQGGTLLLPAEELQWDMAGLADFIARHGGSHMICLPSLYLLLLEQAEARQLSALRTVVVAGEACPAEVVGRHRRLLPETRLYNEYGPTESTVWCTVADIGELDPAGTVPIGGPIPNTRVYLRGPDGEPVAIGLPGELHAAGPGLARGYLGQPALTAERFLPDPFGGEPGGRLYRTGDLARYRPDGTLDFLGRADDQLKIRGFRVELGEVEASLLRHPAVLQSAVAAREDGPGGARLVAYVVPREAAEPLEELALRAFLQRVLPEYMVPSAFVFLESLPLNANGKVDRKALPAPQARRAGEYIAPRSDLERTLAAVWREVLQVDEVGIHDNFFDLGGHSLLMVRVHRKLREAVSTDLSVVDLFRYPTIGALAELLSQGAGPQQDQLAEKGEERAEARKASTSRQRDAQARRRAARGE